MTIATMRTPIMLTIFRIFTVMRNLFILFATHLYLLKREMVPLVGIEPTTFGLKARYSTN